MTRARVLEVTSARGEVEGGVEGPPASREEELNEMRLDIISALMGLGCTKKSATSRVARALEAFRERGQKPGEEDLLREALRRGSA
jgi:hypothetical protein